jgi:hypothetical protein
VGCNIIQYGVCEKYYIFFQNFSPFLWSIHRWRKQRREE